MAGSVAGSRLGSTLLVTAVVGGLLVWAASPGEAACHAFTVSAAPAEPGEGDTVTLTIRRDGAVQPSSVRVRTVDGSAEGGDDFAVLDERVEFESGVEQTREIDVMDDEVAEDAETFSVELSEAEGCPINQNFSYGTATVAIQDDDEASGEEAPAEETEPASTDDGDGDVATGADDDEDDAAGDELAETGVTSMGRLVLAASLGPLLGMVLLLRTRRSAPGPRR